MKRNPSDLERFYRTQFAVAEHYKCRVHTVVLCGPRTRVVPPPIDLAPIPYRLTRVRLGDQGGEAALARLRALMESGVPGARRTAWTWHYCR